MEINYQENKVQQKQELFDLETKRKIQNSLQEIYNKQQRQQQAANGNSGGNGRKGRFIKFVHDGELTPFIHRAVSKGASTVQGFYNKPSD
jgi:hypothetical protein